ncbi:hypothetical protein [Halopiger djelfimassiliensis]|uniref:hypothetical protein n=1 Tax=Halopiger djelfimassiliensis TaxID=1293047 RepID=UPI000677FD67|nr:hypothetical protein [Halopiger djelfimassiliensis]
MSGADRYKLFGVYVSQPVVDALEEYVYDEAGVLDLETYFDETADSVPRGDPGATATDELVAAVVDDFAALYDAADFEAAARIDPDAFVLVRLAAAPRRVARVRERFQAAATIRETDLRTVQTAILSASVSVAPNPESKPADR